MKSAGLSHQKYQQDVIQWNLFIDSAGILRMKHNKINVHSTWVAGNGPTKFDLIGIKNEILGIFLARRRRQYLSLLDYSFSVMYTQFIHFNIIIFRP